MELGTGMDWRVLFWIIGIFVTVQGIVIAGCLMYASNVHGKFKTDVEILNALRARLEKELAECTALRGNLERDKLDLLVRLADSQHQCRDAEQALATLHAVAKKTAPKPRGGR